MAASDLVLVNAALSKLGASPIASLTGGDAVSALAAALYAPVRDGLLSTYPWTFATKQVSLGTPSSPAPVADYSYAFDLPIDHLRTLAVGAGGAGNGVPFRQVSGQIQTALPSIVLTYVARVAETEFPAYFDLLLMARLAAELCVPVTENASRAEGLYRLAELEFSRARSVDAQQDTPARIARFPLVDVRG